MGDCYNPIQAPYRKLSVNDNPITSSNPIPTSGGDYIDLVNNPQIEFNMREDGQPTRETATLVDGRVYYRDFTYNDGNMLILRTKWILV